MTPGFLLLSVNFYDLYDLAFSGTWNSNSYSVGYQMAKIITNYDSNREIGILLSHSPQEFAAEYVRLSQLHPEDSETVKFDPSLRI